MKKTLVFCFLLSLTSLVSHSQEASVQPLDQVEEINTSKISGDKDFDNTWRFGLKVTPQTCWFGNADKNIQPNGNYFGYGFGLQMEYHFSETICLVTGIGGDFEGGKYSSTYDPTNSYQVSYWLNSEGNMIQPENNTNVAGMRTTGNSEYILKDRTIKTTFITIPAILKMSTNEINGFKYFGMFGGEMGIRVKSKADDTYYHSYQYSSTSTATDAITSQTNIDLSKDSPLIPIRIGLNFGIGTEYRLSGKTSLMVNANYYHSFINVLKSTSDYMVSNVSPDGNTFTFVKQSFLMNAIRLNIGILF